MNLLSRRQLLATAPLFVIALAGAAAASRMTRMQRPARLDVSLSKATDKALYLVRIAPQADPVRVGRMHDWTLEITTRSGRAVDTAEIVVSGGMPEHGHGLPTAPRARSLGGGRWVIEGMKFSMPGWWVIDLAISGKPGGDTVRFNYIL